VIENPYDLGGVEVSDADEVSRLGHAFVYQMRRGVIVARWL